LVPAFFVVVLVGAPGLEPENAALLFELRALVVWDNGSDRPFDASTI